MCNLDPPVMQENHHGLVCLVSVHNTETPSAVGVRLPVLWKADVSMYDVYDIVT